ncbi:uncharacterized protein [Lolium perenne]|uniref:uncharacterized protein n=1 Tax=Lolium perenne TaxID=4522 RepID=UPI003A99AA77
MCAMPNWRNCGRWDFNMRASFILQLAGYLEGMSLKNELDGIRCSRLFRLQTKSSCLFETKGLLYTFCVANKLTAWYEKRGRYLTFFLQRIDVKGKWRRTYLEEDSEQSAAICSSRAISNTQWKFFLMLYLERVREHLEEMEETNISLYHSFQLYMQ